MGFNGQFFDFVISAELDAPVEIKLCDLEGCLRSFGPEFARMDVTHVYATFQVFCNGRPVGMPVMSRYKDSSTKTEHLTRLKTWGEWIELPVMYSELSRDAFLFIVLWNVGMDAEPVYVAQAVKTLFSKRGIFRKDFIHIRMHRTDSGNADPFWKPTEELSRDAKFTSDPANALEKKRKLYCSKMIDHVQWLDSITLAKIEQVKQAKKLEDKSLMLMIQLAKVVYEDTTYSVVHFDFELPKPLGLITDREMGLENLCELKHHALTRNARTDESDRHLKPNAGARDALETIIKMPSSQVMSVEQRDLIWKFRYYLQQNKKALTKFSRSVNWADSEEANQAIRIIKDWEPIDPVDALELLSPDFHNIQVRKYAVTRLEVTEVDKILLYLPQLVQALRYDGDLTASYIQESLIAAQSIDDSEEGAQDIGNIVEAKKDEKTKRREEKEMAEIHSSFDLKGLLIHFACNKLSVANYLFWYLKVEIEVNEKIDKMVAALYSEIMDDLVQALKESSELSRRYAYYLEHQQKFVKNLVVVAEQVQKEGGKRETKEKIARSLMSENPELLDLEGLPLPLDPNIRVDHVLAQMTSLFQSNLMPMKLSLRKTGDDNGAEPYVTIFKRGDDLRQDQLVVQMVRLFDRIWRDNALDLKLTPYWVLATSAKEGFVQFVKGTPLRVVSSTYKGGIQEMLRSFRPSKTGPYGIEEDAMTNYIRSCAGYCVITYILAIGDRHMDNLLICENGKMFHIDFGFILGRDPKPMPPPMKLNYDMINAMGGANSEHFKQFLDFCFQAFNILRQNANVILNLFSLMLDAGIPDIAEEKDKAVQKIERRLHLNVDEEHAAKIFQEAVESSINATMAKLSDYAHDLKLYVLNSI
ncbi:hypothetical protein QR680_008420 [Steinernema hermaphroditum]|uniref:Phosphatidylinositol 3-kinase catalytic subunit type 3 n=1 Tax=Steinernema hermaphroditum TaxID=289476 RepID=A0AA39IGI8_9BILA|nr:hypothetical protein QR680_008420 [Steinernema hermaphroditum]